MKNFIVYNSSGEILRTGSCPDSVFSAQAQDGEFIMEGVCEDDANYSVVNGALVYTPVVTTVEEVQQKIRSARTSRLKASDWTQVPDASLTDAKKLEWRTYRQALRDLPAQYQNETDFANVVFPNPPE